ncbi:hypothetical protein PHMEG_00030008 [Phytophthora megakarya]|uniref:Transposase n=1 Tax=Phytophthora megakarya TaxID=4795 RepID=A0A225V1B5_9STRA|nr:hypothetical protein PHMEG_00030008 [Phytophthora megakarya]
MTCQNNIHWRAVVILHMYDVPLEHVSELLGAKQRTLRRWHNLFLREGIVNDKAKRNHA